MADFMSGIRQITPTYPVRPTQPAQKDRDPDGNRKKKPTDPAPERRNDDDDDAGPRPTIDEHV